MNIAELHLAPRPIADVPRTLDLLSRHFVASKRSGDGSAATADGPWALDSAPYS